jgi:hypothetical protein
LELKERAFVSSDLASCRALYAFAHENEADSSIEQYCCPDFSNANVNCSSSKACDRCVDVPKSGSGWCLVLCCIATITVLAILFGFVKNESPMMWNVRELPLDIRYSSQDQFWSYDPFTRRISKFGTPDPLELPDQFEIVHQCSLLLPRLEFLFLVTIIKIFGLICAGRLWYARYHC